jgi:4-carboxymuconolactone decarboxylase
MNPKTYPTRITPLQEEELTEEQLEMLKPWRVKGRLFNLFTVYAKNQAMTKAWNPWGSYVFAQTNLSHRQTELLILRTTWLCHSPYEFGHHIAIAMARGLTEEEIVSVAERGSTSDRWNQTERALLAAAEEIERSANVSDATWKQLEVELPEAALMDVVMTCGTYRIGSIMTNSLGIQLEDDYPIPPGLRDLLSRVTNH